ncbi:hypothetical protein Tco_1240949 [Tanacetum coccineum]
MSTLNQQTLADSEANERPPMLERGNYIPWPMIPDPDGVVNLNGTMKEVLEPLSKMTKGNKKQYIADMKVMNYLLQAIPNDIYNSVDASKEGELLEFVYERLTTLVNIMDRNSIRPNSVSINTKFLNCLQPEWSKYVTMVHHNQTGEAFSYYMLYDSLVQFEPHVLVSKAKKSAKNHDPLALIAHSTASSSQSHANSSYSPGHYASDCQKPRVRDAKYFREQMLLAMKDEAGSNLTNKENDFLLDTSYGEETMEELTAAIMLMARIQPTNGNAETVPSYDVKAIIEVNASSKVHDQMRHEKHKTIIQTYNDDQFDSIIIFDDPYVENKGGTSDHDSNDHDEYHKIQTLAYDVQREAENQKRLNNELKKQKMLLQQELEMCKDQTYAYADVWDQNQDLLMAISELKNKLKIIKKGKDVNTKFDKSETSGTLLCVTLLPKNIAVKANKVSNTKVNADRSKPVTSHSIPKNEQSVESSNSVRRPKSKDTKSKDRVLKNTNDKRSSA